MFFWTNLNDILTSADGTIWETFETDRGYYDLALDPFGSTNDLIGSRDNYLYAVTSGEVVSNPGIEVFHLATGGGLLVGLDHRYAALTSDGENWRRAFDRGSHPFSDGITTGISSSLDLIVSSNRFFHLDSSGYITSVRLTDTVPATGPGKVAIRWNAGNFSEPEEPLDIQLYVSRIEGIEGAVSVEISQAASSTADLGVDFTLSESTLSWAPGEDTQHWVTCTLLPDTLVEGPETIVLEFTNLTGGLEADTAHAIIEIAVRDRLFDQWRFDQFPDPAAALAQPKADFDGDGVLNFMEFVLGTDPKGADADLAQALLMPRWDANHGIHASSLSLQTDERITLRQERTDSLDAVDWTQTPKEWWMWRSSSVFQNNRRNVEFAWDLTSGDAFHRLVFDFPE